MLGLWAGTGGEGAKFWLAVLTDLRNRGVKDTVFLVCDGLKGLPEVVGNVWPLTTVQTCIIHLIRNTFRLASRKDWDALRHDVKPIYTAPTPAAARSDRHVHLREGRYASNGMLSSPGLGGPVESTDQRQDPLAVVPKLTPRLASMVPYRLW